MKREIEKQAQTAAETAAAVHSVTETVPFASKMCEPAEKKVLPKTKPQTHAERKRAKS